MCLGAARGALWATGHRCVCASVRVCVRAHVRVRAHTILKISAPRASPGTPIAQHPSPGHRATLCLLKNNLIFSQTRFLWGDLSQEGNGRVVAAGEEIHPDAPDCTFWAQNIHGGVAWSVCVCLGAVCGALQPSGHRFVCQNGPPTHASFSQNRAHKKWWRLM